MTTSFALQGSSTYAGSGNYADLGSSGSYPTAYPGVSAMAATLTPAVGVPSPIKAGGRVQTIQPAGLGTYIEDYVGAVPSAIGGTIENFYGATKSAATAVAVSAGDGIQYIASDVGSAYNGVKNVATSITSGVEKTVTGAENTITGFASGVQADIQGAFSIVPWIFGLAVLGVGVFAYLEARKAGLI